MVRTRSTAHLKSPAVAEKSDSDGDESTDTITIEINGDPAPDTNVEPSPDCLFVVDGKSASDDRIVSVQPLSLPDLGDNEQNVTESDSDSDDDDIPPLKILSDTGRSSHLVHNPLPKKTEEKSRRYLLIMCGLPVTDFISPLQCVYFCDSCFFPGWSCSQSCALVML